MTLLRDIKRIAQNLRPEAGAYGVGIGSLVFLNLADVLAPLFMAVAIDLTEAALTGGEARTPPILERFGITSGMFSVLGAISLFVGLHLVANVLRYPMLMYTAVPSHRCGQRVRNRLVRKLFSLSRPWFDRTRSGDLMSLGTADVLAVRMMLGPAILVGTDTLLLLFFVLVLLFSLSWQLALIAMIPLPLIALVTNRLSHMEYRRFSAVQEDLSFLTERARESYAGIRIMQGYARESFDRARFDRFSWRHYRRNLELARVRSLFEPTLDLMLGLSTVLVLIFGGLQLARGTMTLGTFVAFLFLVGYLSGPMIGFGWSVSLFQRGRASMDRLYRLFDEPVEIPEAKDPRALERVRSVEVRDLTFRYGDESAPVLRDISLRLEAGQTLGIIGPVGSGKSSLAALLVRLYEAPPGTIFIDGVDIREVDTRTLRRAVVLAPQDNFLFSDTVARNITLALDRTDADATHFARLAELHHDVEGLSAGYDTLLGERGVNLSGGQRQRLAIARAIAADPDVLILDDCLSAVDARTEDAILGHLDEIFGDRSGVLISHRVRAVERCDHILVLEEGRISEQGTHAELLASGGYYARTAAQQQQEEARAAADGEGRS